MAYAQCQEYSNLGDDTEFRSIEGDTACHSDHKRSTYHLHHPAMEHCI